MKVSWVTGREKALATAVAMFVAEASGRDWMRMGIGERQRMENAARSQVKEWIAADVLARFDYPFCEPEDAIPNPVPEPK